MSIKVVVFVAYVIIVGCAAFEIFKLPWYNAVDTAMRRTHYLEESVQKTCMVWATAIGAVMCICLSSLIYYFFLKKMSHEISECEEK